MQGLCINMFKVEIRTDCKVCGNDLPKGFRTFCSKTCRQKETNRRTRDYQRKWQQDKRGEYAEGKKKCIICEKWYVQLGTHVIQAHEYDSAREYREDNHLPLKRGIVPKWYRKLKGDLAKKNGTYKNLKAGKKFWYEKGDKKAKVVTGYKGRNAPPSEYF